MNKILNEILQKKQYTNTKGEVFKVKDETPREQCEFLENIIIQKGFKSSLEIGFAMGISAAAIIEPIVKNGGHHITIDPFQNDKYWNGNGLDLINKLGFSNKLEFYENYSYQVLPKLLDERRLIDFAYLDTTKQFDWLLVDFFFLDKILVTGGIIVFDDVEYQSIRKLVRFISKFPNYAIYDQYPENSESPISRIVSGLKKFKRTRKLAISEILDQSIGVNCRCIALQKLGDDNRTWNWHVDF